ncbi:hypothetical protein UCRPC4_g01086 [Phaeomoniella chlamydospora]|uniref:Arylsulfotransferase n=1 Tax=Phaeomoniella chlamydospora TaxID=158046 RepID=A0A0G2EZK3_PHACM|nr:hypothetical protein UCRPC4_g01086 [Phaeomoniella chlamydospora]
MGHACLFVLALITFTTASPSPDGEDFARFHTLPNLRPPLLNVTLFEPGLESPPTASYQPDQTGPAIYDNHGHLIWSGASSFPGRNAYDFRAVTPEARNQSELSFIISKNKYLPERPNGAAVRLNSAYELVEETAPLSGTPFFNIHEYNIINNGTSVLLVYSDPVKIDGIWVFDDGFAEIDLTTGTTLFKWNSLANLHLNSSYLKQPEPKATSEKNAWDWFHANSVDKNSDGDYIISSRHTSCIYKISGTDGSILWKLGGKDSHFDHIAGFNFLWQHDARFRFENTTTTIISLFNNAGTGDSIKGQATAPWSSALVVALETSITPMTARVLQRFDRPDHQRSIARGNVQILPNENVLVGWAADGYISEFSPSGSLALEARFVASKMISYRSYKFNFTGTPSTPPSTKSYVYGTSPKTATTVLYVSWNGATEVASWNFYGSSSSSSSSSKSDTTEEEEEEEEEEGLFSLLGNVAKSDFETMFMTNGYTPYIYAEALSTDGKAIGRSIIQASEIPQAWISLGFFICVNQ